MVEAMHLSEDLDELMTCRLDHARRQVEPCSIVIFGASGDLTGRKLIPALYQLFRDKQMPADFRIVGFARREKSDASWRTELREAVNTFSRSKPVDDSVWSAFASRVHYCRGDLTDSAAYVKLAGLIASFDSAPLKQNLLFYLATLPSQFGMAVERLHEAKLLHRGGHVGWQRLVVEKPFGHDLASASALNHELTRFAQEQQVFRIDHYLGKETVQNILTFRFSNAIFERLWHRDAVDHVQITVSERLGVGGRGAYYEEAGALRDMVQNHLLQVLALVAMEPPVSLDAEPIRDEKVKLLSAVRRLQREQVARLVVRGQYTAGCIDGEPRRAYRAEERVNHESSVETFVALKLHLDNWRWAGVPFYLQPNEGISLRFNGKVPGLGYGLRPVRMHFGYDSEFGAYTPEAYERLLLDAMAGDATLFIRRDEVEQAWEIVDSIRAGWEGVGLDEREFYPAGSWGPQLAHELLARSGHAWREPQPLK
jgi:glucose-6-phosphate 1-dehydrogenase